MSKRYIAIAICAVLICAAASALCFSRTRAAYDGWGVEDIKNIVSAAAQTKAIDAQDLSIKYQADEAREQLLDAENQVAQLKAKVKQLDLSRELTQPKIEQAKLLAMYNFQSEAYNVYLIDKNNELLQYQEELLDTQIAIEREKLALDETTQNAVDVLVAQRDVVSQSVVSNETRIELMKQSLVVALEVSSYELPSNFVPGYVLSYPGGLAQTQKGLKASNVTVLEYNNAIIVQQELLNGLTDKKDPLYIKNSAELDRLNSEKDSYLNTLSQIAIGRYVAYEDAHQRHKSAEEMQPSLDEQLRLLDEFYYSGSISKVDYLYQRLNIHKEIYAANAARVTLLNLILELNILEKGVIVQ